MALSPENATVVATARAKVLSVANPAVPTMATQKSSAMTKAPSAATAVEFSTAISGHCPRQRSNHRGNPRQLSCQFPRTSNRSNFHGHPRPSTAIATAILRYAAITTKVRGSPQQFPQHVPQFCPWQTPSHQPCPRKSAAISTAVSAETAVAWKSVWVGVRVGASSMVLKEVRGNCHGSFRGNCRGTEIHKG